MLRKLFGRRAGKSVVMAAAAGALLLATAAALPGGVALADGPDDAPLSSSVNAGVGAGPGVSPVGGGASGGGADTAGGLIRKNMFKGHAFNTGRVSATGLPLVACLGGCDAGYVSEPIIVGFEGRYSGLTVERPAGTGGVETITFWLGEGDDRVQADQVVTFQDNALIRELALNFEEIPDANAADANAATADADAAVVPGSAAAASGVAAGNAAGGDWRTTDLTLPDAADLGLVPANSAAGFAATTFRYQGYPLLPGLVMALGLTVAGIGASLLMYRRRRIVW